LSASQKGLVCLFVRANYEQESGKKHEPA